jgi:hypothetical protein
MGAASSFHACQMQFFCKDISKGIGPSSTIIGNKVDIAKIDRP